MTNSMTTQPDGRKVIVGVDTHKHLHVAVAIDTCGIRLGDQSFVADSGGYRPGGRDPDGPLPERRGPADPVLTNLAPSAKPAKVVHCLQLRRQENSFKFLHAHYAIEQLIQYGAAPEAQLGRVPNPKRQALNDRVRRVTEEIEALEADALLGDLNRDQPRFLGDGPILHFPLADAN